MSIFFPKISKIWKNFVFWIPNYPGTISFFSTVLAVYFERARLCSMVLKVCFERAQPYLRYDSTVLEVFSTVLEVCFEFVLDSYPSLDYSFSVGHRHILAFESRNIKWASRPVQKPSTRLFIDSNDKLTIKIRVVESTKSDSSLYKKNCRNLGARVDQNLLSFNLHKRKTSYHKITYVQKIVWNFYDKRSSTYENCMMSIFSWTKKFI